MIKYENSFTTLILIRLGSSVGYKRIGMFRILRNSLSNLRVINNSKRFTFKPMEPVNEIKTVDYEKDQYGDYPFIKSTFRSNRKWTDIKNVNEDLEGKEVLVRARIHAIRQKGNSCFIVLREGFATVQALAFKSEQVTKEMIKYMGAVSNESIVDLTGRVKKPEKPIESCTQQVEL